MALHSFAPPNHQNTNTHTRTLPHCLHSRQFLKRPNPPSGKLNSLRVETDFTVATLCCESELPVGFKGYEFVRANATTDVLTPSRGVLIHRLASCASLRSRSSPFGFFLAPPCSTLSSHPQSGRFWRAKLGEKRPFASQPSKRAHLRP